MPTICVDVMGSDQGPSVVLEGVERALAKDAELVVLLAGSDEEVTPFAEKHDRVRTVVSSEVIGMDEHPANAVRQKKDASIVRAAAAVKQGEADGLFSAGSTGAVLTAATFGIGRIKGIKRPALALILPGLDGHRTVFLDTGANADVKPELMVDFARMGIAYAQVALDIQEPSVGLLTNGAEDTKGSELTLAYHDILAHAKVNFSGNAEGVDLLGSRFDVIVADGMTGNVALKSIESTGRFILSRIKDSVATSKKAALGALLLKDSLKKTAGELSGDTVGGAVLLGLSAPVIKAHGSAGAGAVCAGILAAATAVRGNLVGKITEAIQVG